MKNVLNAERLLLFEEENASTELPGILNLRGRVFFFFFLVEMQYRHEGWSETKLKEEANGEVAGRKIEKSPTFASLSCFGNF